ncbi:hypothetical protein ABZ746_23210 [Streptomyces sp. NPDC020096]
MDAMQQLCDEITDLLMDIRVLRADAQHELYATAATYAPEAAPVADEPVYELETPVYELETDEERVLREEGERMLADALAAEREAQWIAEREAEAAAVAMYAPTVVEIDAAYRDHCERQWLAAEDWCRGVLLSGPAAAAGVDPRSLFSGPAHVAFARASEELRSFWSEIEPRMTKTEFTARLTGRWTVAARTAQHAAHDCAMAV